MSAGSQRMRWSLSTVAALKELPPTMQHPETPPTRRIPMSCTTMRGRRARVARVAACALVCCAAGSSAASAAVIKAGDPIIVDNDAFAHAPAAGGLIDLHAVI